MSPRPKERGVYAVPFTSAGGRSILVAIDSRGEKIGEVCPPAHAETAVWDAFRALLDVCDPVPVASPLALVRDAWANMERAAPRAPARPAPALGVVRGGRHRARCRP